MFKPAHAVNTDWKAGGDACLDQLEINPGDESKDLEHLLEDLRERSGISYWVGSVGLGVCTLNRSHCGEFCEVSAMVMMTANLPTGSFILFPSPDGDAEGHGGLEQTTEKSEEDWPEGLLDPVFKGPCHATSDWHGCPLEGLGRPLRSCRARS